MSSSLSEKQQRAERAALIRSWAAEPDSAPFDSGWINAAQPARCVPALPASAPSRLPSSSDGALLSFERSIVDMDTISAMLASRAAGETPCGLIFCSSRRPGGGWESGARAQEEDVSLASLWALQAERVADFYNASEGVGALNADALIHASRSLILFDAQGALLDQPEPCSFIGFAAPNATGLASQGHDPLSGRWPGAIEKSLLTRARATLRLAAEAGSPPLILGAIGCGVFGLAPELVARCWKSALEQALYAGPVRFAIPNAQGPVGSVFASTLGLSQQAPRGPQERPWTAFKP